MKVLVTGGHGFLGSAIVGVLQEHGHVVTALGRNRYLDLERAGIKTVQADVRDAAAIRTAATGMDAVIHTAAIAGIWGPKKLFWDINYQGTRNVLNACRDAGVRHLVYTSSPSVVFGDHELCGVDESQPYPIRYLAHYPASKAAAEQAVLGANGPNLKTVALRPHLIFGPGDPHLFPRIIARARVGKLVQIGAGTNLVDVTFVNDAASAHILALDQLRATETTDPEPRASARAMPPHTVILGTANQLAACAGKAYFISQGEPVNLWSWLREILAQLGFPPPRGPISARTAYAMGAILEAAYRLFATRSEPRLTRFLAQQLSESHYFDISAARRDLGYQPAITIHDATARLVAWLRQGT